MELSKDLQARQEVRDLVEAAAQAQNALRELDQAAIDRIVQAMAQAGSDHAQELAELACSETGFGITADKVEKNRFASQRVWERIRELKTVGVLWEDATRKIWEIAVPVGVIAGIVPSTNPTSTVIYKAMIALKAGNTIVFSPHPGAKACTIRAAQILAEAAQAAGCPKGAIGCIRTPSMDAVDELMKHPKIRLILATGGGAMVRAAYSSGKPAIGVGAGNGPAYLHESCDWKQAVADIVRSKTFDNGTICASEQSIIVERSNAKRAEAELIRQGCWILNEDDAKRLAGILFRDNGTMNPKIVGKPASEIAKLAGLSAEARQARVLIARETGAGKGHPFSYEKLCPVLGLYVVENQDEALELACQVLHHEGSGHTFTIHTQDSAVVRRFALRVPVSRLLVNTPAALGGIGGTTNLFPALTLGCGAVGGSSSSNNIGPMDLLNIRRVAWGTQNTGVPPAETASADERLVELLTQKLLQKLTK